MIYEKHRELTRAERTAIRKLVKEQCANYDCKCGCLLFNDECYMFYGVAFTNTGMCKYFRNAVLPADSILEAILTSNTVIETRTCPICSKDFPVNNKQLYCTNVCADEAHRRRNRENMRKSRGR